MLHQPYKNLEYPKCNALTLCSVLMRYRPILLNHLEVSKRHQRGAINGGFIFLVQTPWRSERLNLLRPNDVFTSVSLKLIVC
jgi:hypothetical protein